jgi:hypothetical protein
MAFEFKPNFFTSAATKPAPTMPEIMWANDPKYRAAFGTWLADNFDILASEYQQYGRFLSLHEINNPLD